MELRLERATRLPRPPWWAVLIVLGWIAWIVTSSAAFAGGDDAGTLCHFKRFTGVPCVGCGGSRGARAIVEGRPQDAFSLNPGLFFMLTVWGALLLRRAVTGQRIVVRFSPRGRVIAWTVATLLFIASWAYVIWRQGTGG